MDFDFTIEMYNFSTPLPKLWNPDEDVDEDIED
jgi:hypothetical protein